LAYVPDEIRRCVVFLGYEDDNQKEHVIGSAFWIVDTRFGHHPASLVTAAHVLDDVIKKHGKDHVLMKFNYREGGARWEGICISRWERHPDKSVDVCFMRIAITPEMDHAGIPVSMFVTAETAKEDSKNIEVGDEIFFPGMFWPHHGFARNIPIVRVGNIASIREEKVDTQYGEMDAYLVEARSIGGLSGSPAFMDVIAARLTKEIPGGKTMLVGSSRFRLVGMINGHFIGTDQKPNDKAKPIPVEELERLNMGIAFMTPSDRILQGLDVLFAEEDKRAEEDAKKRRFARSSLDSVPQTNSSAQITRS
jgi:hypothetical protein